MSAEQDDVSTQRVRFSTYPISASEMQPLTSFVRHGSLEHLEPRLIDLRPTYQSDAVLQASYFNYGDNASAFMLPTVPIAPSLSTIPVLEEEKIDVGVEETDPNRLIVANITPENFVTLPPQLELSLKISQQLQEYHHQLLRLHEDLMRKAQDPISWHRYFFENYPLHTAHSIDKILHLPPVIDKNRPYYAYVQQTLIREQQQRSASSGEQMTNVNRKIELKNAYEIQNVQEKCLQTDLPEQSQYNMNEYKNRLQMQLIQRSASKPIDLVTYNTPPPPLPPPPAVPSPPLPPRQLPPVQYMFQGYEEPLDLAMPKKCDMTERGLAVLPPPAHNNPASTQEPIFTQGILTFINVNFNYEFKLIINSNIPHT